MTKIICTPIIVKSVLGYTKPILRVDNNQVALAINGNNFDKSTYAHKTNLSDCHVLRATRLVSH